MKYCSVIMVHFGQRDEFGELNTRQEPRTRPEMMRQSFDSLVKNTDYPIEVIVMDNGGNPDDSDFFLQMVREGKIDTLVRYKSNMNFAFAWNQGFRLATGDYVCFTCNDIEYLPGWLSTCIGLLEKYPERKLIATPLITRDKNNHSYNKEVLPDARINSMAGSACFIVTPETFKDIGEMAHHRVGGSIWHRRMSRKGYMAIVPPVNMANHLAHRWGTDYRRHIEIERTLLKGEKVNYTYTYKDADVDYYDGVQKPAGVKL